MGFLIGYMAGGCAVELHSPVSFLTKSWQKEFGYLLDFHRYRQFFCHLSHVEGIAIRHGGNQMYSEVAGMVVVLFLFTR
ncbi:hypothetical protein SAMN05216327_12415 [Dyadobacter sp. SG02]|nr:hypothetical protein SAMN05216327_12415 [Dyadobacter sp. SG02]